MSTVLASLSGPDDLRRLPVADLDGLAQEIRLLGTAALPVPVPSGIAEQRVSVGGESAVLLADPSGAAAGVIWEGGDGVVHGVGGLLDRKDVLNVARQLG